MSIWFIRTVMAMKPFLGIQLHPGETSLGAWACTYTCKPATRSP
jgi:hypothetical protein